MQMVVVSMTEAHARLPELVLRIAAGDQVVIAEGGRWVASLTAPPPMPMDEAVRRARVREAIREMVRGWVADGVEVPADHPLADLLREGD